MKISKIISFLKEIVITIGIFLLIFIFFFFLRYLYARGIFTPIAKLFDKLAGQ